MPKSDNPSSVFPFKPSEPTDAIPESPRGKIWREDEILIPSAEAARILLCKPQTLRVRRLKGGKGCIPYVRLGESRKARVAYRLSDLKAYLAARVYTNTAEESVKESEVQEGPH
ncbi:MAG: hypothetical protein ACP5VF_05905 [Acidobacteriota bacterium]